MNLQMPRPTPHILVVNDDAVVTMVTARILGSHGYRVTTAKSGDAALDMLKAETPDLMILDIQMPEMDGIEMIARMEEFVPFLIQSSLPDDDPRVITLMECGSIGRVSTKSLLGDVERALGTT